MARVEKSFAERFTETTCVLSTRRNGHGFHAQRAASRIAIAAFTTSSKAFFESKSREAHTALVAFVLSWIVHPIPAGFLPLMRDRRN